MHPAQSRAGALVHWAQVAAWAGRTMHRLAEFHRISDALPSFGGEPKPWSGQPEAGNLTPEVMRALCAILRNHTATSHACWFCVWHGWGDLHGHRGAPCVSLPNREYLLFEGPLDAALNRDWTLDGSIFGRQSPNVFWPADHAWCVASEIDLYATLVGGTEALAHALVADPTLEAWRVEPTDSITCDGDRINM